MNIQEWAEKLNGREYREELTDTEDAQAAVDGVVIVFGASDDLCEFRGAINEEIGCYRGGIAFLGKKPCEDFGLIENECEDERCPHFERIKARAVRIKIIAGKQGWEYQTVLPHAKFKVVEDGHPYGEGIVFSMSDLVDAWKARNPRG